MEGSDWSCCWYYYTDSLSLTKAVEAKRSHSTDVRFHSGHYMWSFWSLILSSRLRIFPTHWTLPSPISLWICVCPLPLQVFFLNQSHLCLPQTNKISSVSTLLLLRAVAKSTEYISTNGKAVAWEAQELWSLKSKFKKWEQRDTAKTWEKLFTFAYLSYAGVWSFFVRIIYIPNIA